MSENEARYLHYRRDQPSAGRLMVVTSDGYPVWCDLYVDGKVVARLHHRDLNAAVYVLRRTKDVAREKLGRDNFREV